MCGRSSLTKTEKELEERFQAQLKLAALPRNGSKTRIRNRCEVTGRPRAYYRKLRRPRIAPRAQLSGPAARLAGPRRTCATLAAQRLGQRPHRPAVRHRARVGTQPHQPAAGQGVNAGRTCRGHLPRRRAGGSRPRPPPGGSGRPRSPPRPRPPRPPAAPGGKRRRSRP